MGLRFVHPKNLVHIFYLNCRNLILMNVNTILCEELTAATFGRQNLLGANFSDSITAPEFPYLLHTTFFTLINLEVGESARKIELELILNEVSSFKQSINGPENSEKNFNVRIAWSSLDILLKSTGNMELRVSVDGALYSQKWKVLTGPASLRANSGALPPALLIDSRLVGKNPLNQLLAEARNEILIADQFVTLDFLQELLSDKAKNLRVRIITNETRGFNKEEAKKLMANFSNLEIRFDRLFHDRLVCRDSEEVYVFGASLKDILHGRVSFFQRLFDHQQTVSTLALLNECWEKAAQI